MSLMESFLPHHQFAERHQTGIRCPPGELLDIIQNYRPPSDRLGETAMFARQLPTRLMHWLAPSRVPPPAPFTPANFTPLVATATGKLSRAGRSVLATRLRPGRRWRPRRIPRLQSSEDRQAGDLVYCPSGPEMPPFSPRRRGFTALIAIRKSCSRHIGWSFVRSAAYSAGARLEPFAAWRATWQHGWCRPGCLIVLHAKLPSPPDRLPHRETVETLYLLGEQDRIVGVSGYAVRPAAGTAGKGRGYRRSFSADYSKNPGAGAGSGSGVLRSSSQYRRRSRARGRGDPCLQPARRRRHFGDDPHAGAMVGASERADRLAAEYQARLATIASTPRPSPRPKVYFEEWDDPLISGIGLGVSELVEIAGGEDALPNLAGPSGGKGPDHLAGAVRKAAPDVILASWCGKKVVPDRIRQRPGWNEIPGRARQPHRRDQVAADTSAWPGGADGRAGCDREGAVAVTVPRMLRNMQCCAADRGVHVVWRE